MPFTSHQEDEILDKVRQLHSVFIGSPEVPGKFMELHHQVEVQGRRLDKLERFQWVLSGGGILLAGILYRMSDVVRAAIAISKVALVSTLLAIPWSLRNI